MSAFHHMPVRSKKATCTLSSQSLTSTRSSNPGIFPMDRHSIAGSPIAAIIAPPSTLDRASTVADRADMPVELDGSGNEASAQKSLLEGSR